MNKIRYKKDKNLLVIRLFSGDNLFEKIEEICKKLNIHTAFFISGIGQIKDFQIGYFNKKQGYLKKNFKKPHELLNLSGNILYSNEEYIIHSHAILGDENCGVIGGHLFSAKINLTCEIGIILFDISLKRILEQDTGLMGMFLE